MKLLSFLFFLFLASTAQASVITHHLERRLSTISSSKVNCSPKNPNEKIYGSQTMICEISPAPAQGKSVKVVPSAPQLVFSRCSMTFTSEKTTYEVTVTVRPGPCSDDGTNRHEIKYTYESDDSSFNKNEDYQIVKTYCVNTGTCVVAGDPHITPFNGETIHFMGTGEYVILESKVGLRIVGSYYSCGPNVSCMGGISIQYGECGYIWNLQNNYGNSDQGVHKMAGLNGNGISYSTDDGKVIFTLDDGSTIIINTNGEWMDATIMVSSRHYKKVSGQCNCWDNNINPGPTSKKYLHSNGQIVTSDQEFCQSWKVKDTENPFAGKKITLTVEKVFTDVKCEREPDNNPPDYNPCGYSNGKCEKTERETSTKPPTESTSAPAEATKTQSKESDKPTGKPSGTQTNKPTEKPSDTLIDKPTEKPSDTLTGKPTGKPSETQTEKPTGKPSDTLTNKPTGTATENPTTKPTASPTSSAEEVNPGVKTTSTNPNDKATSTSGDYNPKPTTPVEPPKCPESFKKQAEDKCKELIESVTGCEKICPLLKDEKIKQCIADAVRVCNYNFCPSHVENYKSICAQKAQNWVNSNDEASSEIAQQVQQQNKFGQFAKDNKDCGANGVPTSTGCKCKDGYSGAKCDQNLAALPAYNIAPLYDHNGQPIDSKLNKNLLDPAQVTAAQGTAYKLTASFFIALAGLTALI